MHVQYQYALIFVHTFNFADRKDTKITRIHVFYGTDVWSCGMSTITALAVQVNNELSVEFGNMHK